VVHGLARKPECEGATHTGLALQGEVPTHEPCQLPADREAESGSPPFTGMSPLDLREGAEHVVDLLGNDPDARILHANISIGYFLGRDCTRIDIPRGSTGDDDLSASHGKLHGVGEKIHQDLPYTVLVPDEERAGVVAGVSDLDLFPGGLRMHQAPRCGSDGGKRALVVERVGKETAGFGEAALPGWGWGAVLRG